MCCSRENPQTSVALHCFALLRARTWAWYMAVWQSQRRGQPPCAAPVPPRAAKLWPSHPRLWREQTQADLVIFNPTFTARGLWHNHEDNSETSSGLGTKVCKSGLGEDNALHNCFPPPLSHPEQKKTLCYDNFINSHWDRDALLLSQSQNQAHSTASIS